MYYSKIPIAQRSSTNKQTGNHSLPLQKIVTVMTITELTHIFPLVANMLVILVR